MSDPERGKSSQTSLELKSFWISCHLTCVENSLTCLSLVRSAWIFLFEKAKSGEWNRLKNVWIRRPVYWDKFRYEAALKIPLKPVFHYFSPLRLWCYLFKSFDLTQPKIDLYKVCRMVYLKFSFGHVVDVKSLFFKMLRMLVYKFSKTERYSFPKAWKVNGKKLERYPFDRVFDSLSNDIFHLWLLGLGVTIFVKQAFSHVARPFWSQLKECYCATQRWARQIFFWHDLTAYIRSKKSTFT